MDAAEQRWRDAGFVHYVPNLDDSDNENDPTLIPSHDTSLEDTLTEDCPVNRMDVINEGVNNGVGNRGVVNEEEGNGGVNKGMENDGDGDYVEVINEGMNDNDDSGIVDVDRSGIDDSGICDEHDVLEIGHEKVVNESVEGDEVFEDCVEDDDFARVAANYSLEMKLALGIEDKH